MIITVAAMVLVVIVMVGVAMATVVNILEWAICSGFILTIRLCGVSGILIVGIGMVCRLKQSW